MECLFGLLQVLVTHPKANIELTRELLQCMRQGQWLNDEVMNFYMALLQVTSASHGCWHGSSVYMCLASHMGLSSVLVKDTQSNMIGPVNIT